MPKTWGAGDYRYEVVSDWPSVEIPGVAADVACDSSGRVYAVVRDPAPDGRIGGILPGSGRMMVFESDGTPAHDLMSAWESVRFSAPHGLWINSDDEVFHADTGLHSVTKYDPRGNVLLEMAADDSGSTGAPGEPFNMPTRATQSSSGDIFVSDGYGQNRVHRFTASGDHIVSWGEGDPVFIQAFLGQEVTGEAGTGPGAFNLPHHVLVDDQDNVYVMDRSNTRCQIFSIDGVYITEWNDVVGPNDAVIDSQGAMHIVSYAGVEIRSLSGELLGRWGEKGEGPGKFTNSPHGMCIDANENLYIGEVGGNNRLQKFVRV